MCPPPIVDRPLAALVSIPKGDCRFDIPLLAVLRAADKHDHQHLAVTTKKTRYPGPKLILYSSTPAPTGLTFERLPRSSRATASATLARVAEPSSANRLETGLADLRLCNSGLRARQQVT
jgi:hypothetical protein